MKDELTKNLERLRDFAVQSFDKCSVCGRVVSDEDREFTQEYGHCLMCDSEMWDLDRQRYIEMNGGGNPDETSEDKLRTDAYLEGK